MKVSKELTSSIYKGQVRHRRFSPKQHQFKYSLYMLCLDVKEVMANKLPGPIFGKHWYNPIRFVQQDYLKGEQTDLLTRIKNKITSLGGEYTGDRVSMLVQARCFGLYFSPANFYFCYQQNQNGDEKCCYMLAEVSNTPWNQRHYYLVDFKEQNSTQQISEKEFHVSPFMDLNMQYHWQVKPPIVDGKSLLVHIENHRHEAISDSKLFDATLAMQKQSFSKRAILNIWLSLPFMTFKIVGGIYWQALKLFVKKIPFISYQVKN